MPPLSIALLWAVAISTCAVAGSAAAEPQPPSGLKATELAVIVNTADPLSVAIGETLIEAYWKSVLMPGQGLFIGEPLAAPFRARPQG